MQGETAIVCRGVRGAACVSQNTREAIIEAAKYLCTAIFEANDMLADDVASILFSVTPDLTATFPAAAVRELGLTDVPVLCMQEIPVPDAPRGCIRVLMHWNTTRAPSEVEHVYIGDAAVLRPEWRWPRQEGEA